MKLIIAGSRKITNLTPYWFRDTLNKFGVNHTHSDVITEVVSGCADGIDSLGEKFARKYVIPVKHFPADWNTHGKAAGPIRNKQMAQYADALLLVWDGESKGSASMKRYAKEYGITVYEVVLKNNDFSS